MEKEYGISWLYDVANVSNASDFEVIANASNVIVFGYAFPDLSEWFIFFSRLVMANILIACITLNVTIKCFQLKLQRSAEHAFYCIIAGLMFMSETLMLYRQMVLHVLFGMITLGMAWMGVGVQIIYHWRRHPQLRYFSKHAIFGFCGSVMLLLINSSGTLMLVSPWSSVILRYLLQAHRFSGLISYVTLMTAIMFSYNTGFARRNWSRHHIELLKIATVLLTITTCSHEIGRLVEFVVRNVPTYVFENIHVREDNPD